MHWIKKTGLSACETSPTLDHQSWSVHSHYRNLFLLQTLDITSTRGTIQVNKNSITDLKKDLLLKKKGSKYQPLPRKQPKNLGDFIISFGRQIQWVQVLD